MEVTEVAEVTGTVVSGYEDGEIKGTARPCRILKIRMRSLYLIQEWTGSQDRNVQRSNIIRPE